MPKPVILVVLDGWGISSSPENIINQISLPTFDLLNNNYPMIALQASGTAVGLPWNEAGNSEVGHMTMGAGRIMYQNLVKISMAIKDGSFMQNHAFQKVSSDLQKTKGDLHLFGLVSDGSVHSSRNHLYALLLFAKQSNIKNVWLHLFTDGRDSHREAFGDHILKQIESECKSIGIGQIATIIGRSLAMDRNNNWDRIDKAYQMLVNGKGTLTTDPLKNIHLSYKKGITDEYIEPLIVSDDGTTPRATVKNDDSVIFFNFREDRARQLTKAFVLPKFTKFERGKMLNLNFITMTAYEDNLPVTVAFPPTTINNTLGEILSKNNKIQLRIAETEKYAHVTYFFNAGIEDPFKGEDRLLIPSLPVNNFDEKPEMSAYEITEALIKKINEDKYDFILVNYANADMVAHTGNEEAAKVALKVIDDCMNTLIKTTLRKGGELYITADHGNVEIMHDPRTGKVDTKHNTSLIPFWRITPTNHRKRTGDDILRSQVEINGLLSDIAPTILEVFGIQKPLEMQGESLLNTFK